MRAATVPEMDVGWAPPSRTVLFPPGPILSQNQRPQFAGRRSPAAQRFESARLDDPQPGAPNAKREGSDHQAAVRAEKPFVKHRVGER